MKLTLPVVLILAEALSLAAAVAASTNQPTAAGHTQFRGPIGLQLYSLRDQFAQDVPGTLKLVRSFGIKNVELAGTYNLTPEQFRKELDQQDIKAVSAHFPYNRFRDDLEAVAREAKTLGVEYVGCAWIPHDDKVPFDEKTCREAIAVFNQAGEALAKKKLKFFYHIHGYEFQPFQQGTLLDLFLAETNPKFVSLQLDVFWAVHAGQDPVQLLQKHPKRWQSLHLKGMAEGTPTGLLTGHSDNANSVAVGTGKIPCPPVLRAAKEAGVKWYFLEDESPRAVEQIPLSVRYLLKAKF